MLEERMLNQRMEYIEGVVEKSQMKRDRKYKKMAFMVLKAFQKKMDKERRMEHMCEKMLARRMRMRIKKTFRAIKQYS